MDIGKKIREFREEKNLNIKQLNLEQGNIIIEGSIKGMQYEEESRQKKGLLERFLK